MSDPIDLIIEEALKPLVNGEAYHEDAPFFPRCSAAVREALNAAGYVIALDATPVKEQP